MTDHTNPSQTNPSGERQDTFLALVMVALHVFGFVMAGAGFLQISEGAETGERIVLIGFTAAIVAYVLAICEQEQRRRS